MKKFNIKDFVWFEYVPKSNLTISFLREKEFVLNPALHKMLGSRVDIAFSQTERALALRPSESETALKVLSSGAISAPELTEKLIASGFKPPMYFVAEKQEHYWYAEPDPTKAPKKVNTAKPSKRPRKIDPTRVLEGIDRA